MGRGPSPPGGEGAEQAGGQHSLPPSPQTCISLTQHRCQGVMGVEGSCSLRNLRQLGTDVLDSRHESCSSLGPEL